MSLQFSKTAEAGWEDKDRDGGHLLNESLIQWHLISQSMKRWSFMKNKTLSWKPVCECLPGNNSNGL